MKKPIFKREKKILRDKCGIFGAFKCNDAASIVYLGLHALQHRGQESAGIAVSDGNSIKIHKQMGLVYEIFNQQILGRLEGKSAIGHVRYSTSGDTSLRNAQPITASNYMGAIAICHNGTLTNVEDIKFRLEKDGAIFTTNSDTEIILHLLARSPRGLTVDKIIDSLSQIEGAYSLLFLTEKLMVAVRDPFWIIALALGELQDATLISSESTAFTLVGGNFIRDIQPGEVLILGIDNRCEKKLSIFPFDKKPKHLCIFELIYFARPDSIIDGISVYEARKNMGRQLAIEQPAEADIVIPVPDSGTVAAIGYAQQSKIPFEMGLIRSHYIGRTFIEPSQSIRNFGVMLKLRAVKNIIKGKNVIVIDDSIVRGTTSYKIVKMLRDAGAKKIHVRISSPPTRFPCYYGIDTPTRAELIASFKGQTEIENYLTADSVGYLSLEGCFNALGLSEGFCHACFSGKYPVPVPKHDLKSKQTKLIICEEKEQFRKI